MGEIVLPDQVEEWDVHNAQESADFDAVVTPDATRSELIENADGSVTSNVMQDVEPILEYAKERAASGAGRSPSNEMHELAHFPRVLVERYCVDHGVTFQAFMAEPVHIQRMLADPALSHFLVMANNPHRSYR